MSACPCDGCKWAALAPGRTDHECRRYPAVIDPEGRSRFPECIAQCGEFQKGK